MKIATSLQLLIAVILFSIAPLGKLSASAVPIKQEMVTKKQQNKEYCSARKKKKIALQKRLKKIKQHQEYFSPIWIIPIAWYAISIALLIAGLVIAFPPLWIAAIVLLLIPIAALIVLGVVFFILLMTSSWEC